MPRRKTTTKLVEEAGVQIRLTKKGDKWWYDTGRGSARTRGSLGTTDAKVAREKARDIARQVASHQLTGVRPDTLTLAQVLRAYSDHKLQHLGDTQWARSAVTRSRQFIAAWGADTLVKSISQTSVEVYCAARRAEHITKQRAAFHAREQRRLARSKNAKPQPEPRYKPLRDGALDPDFRWLRSVLNWAVRHRLPNGERLLQFNPLADCDWPREKNPRRPVATHTRFLQTLEQAHRVDPRGRFRLALTLARYTGRRIDAICQLHASDILLSQDAIARALAAAGLDEGDVAEMPDGAIRWRGESDKQGLHRITAIEPDLRDELARYLGEHPRVGEAPLLPSDDDASVPLSRSTATNWIMRAELLAGVPKLAGGLWHAYRRLWATERRHLPDVDVAEAGGWKGSKAMKLSYQHATAAGVRAAVIGARR